jgi:sulfite exporter TauE/SafE
MMDSTLPIYSSALVLGFFGSVHCLGMCGGIAGALGQGLPDQSAGSRFFRSTLYSMGRIASYAMAGALVGFFGETFSAWTGLTVFLRVLAGLLILAFGLHVAGWWNGLAAIERIGLVVWRRLVPITQRIGSPDQIWKTFALGMVWGWLPCGLVYAGLIGAAATGQAATGALFMACFGLGTLPALLAASGFGAQLGAFLALRSARRAAGIVLLLFGLWSIAGAMMPILGGGHGMHGMQEMHGEHSRHSAGATHEQAITAPP